MRRLSAALIAVTSAMTLVLAIPVEAATPATNWGTYGVVPPLAALLSSWQYPGDLHMICSNNQRCTAWEDATTNDPSAKIWTYFAIDELIGGVWQPAYSPPALSGLGNGNVTGDLACSAPGECVAYGTFQNQSGSPEFYVDDESAGVWGDPHSLGIIQVTHVGLDLATLSCSDLRACAVVGWKMSRFGPSVAMVAPEVAGTWGQLAPVPGIEAISGGSSQVTGVSCAAPGDCLAVGTYRVKKGSELNQVFTSEEVGGVWGNAKRIPWVLQRNLGHQAEFDAVACPRPRSCVVVGTYWTSLHQSIVFTQSERDGVWATPRVIPGVVPQPKDALDMPVLIECPALGRCTIAGLDWQSQGVRHVFVTRVVGGSPVSTAILRDPVTHSSTSIGTDVPISMSCPSVDNCGLGFSVHRAGKYDLVGVVNENARTWGNPILLPAVRNQTAELFGVQCYSATYCTATGLTGPGPSPVRFVTR